MTDTKDTQVISLPARFHIDAQFDSDSHVAFAKYSARLACIGALFTVGALVGWVWQGCMRVGIRVLEWGARNDSTGDLWGHVHTLRAKWGIWD